MLGVGLDGWEVVFWSGAAQFKKKKSPGILGMASETREMEAVCGDIQWGYYLYQFGLI